MNQKSGFSEEELQDQIHAIQSMLDPVAIAEPGWMADELGQLARLWLIGVAIYEGRTNNQAAANKINECVETLENAMLYLRQEKGLIPKRMSPDGSLDPHDAERKAFLRKSIRETVTNLLDVLRHSLPPQTILYARIDNVSESLNSNIPQTAPYTPDQETQILLGKTPWHATTGTDEAIIPLKIECGVPGAAETIQRLADFVRTLAFIHIGYHAKGIVAGELDAALKSEFFINTILRKLKYTVDDLSNNAKTYVIDDAMSFQSAEEEVTFRQEVAAETKMRNENTRLSIPAALKNFRTVIDFTMETDSLCEQILRDTSIEWHKACEAAAPKNPEQPVAKTGANLLRGSTLE